MNIKTEITVTYLKDYYGVDYTDRYLSPAPIHNYIFDGNGERYVWSSQKLILGLVEGTQYSLLAITGKSLFGGRGTCISDVQITEEFAEVDFK